jgi:glycosyltransferase involved in cell wall biosynthesis
MTIRVVHDGWPLIHAPLSAAALHLRTLLALIPDGVEPILAMPVPAVPEQQGGPVRILSSSARDAGDWQQRVLPRLADEQKADWIHTTQMAASLLGKVPTIVSPAEDTDAGGSRLSKSLGRGGLARATIAWPEDMPTQKFPGTFHSLHPINHPDFKHGHATLPPEFGLPEEFVLVHGVNDHRLLVRLLESWTWAAASVGEFYPLVILGLDAETKAFVAARLPEFHVEDTVRLMDAVDPQYLVGFYKACIAVVHPGTPVAWGSTLRHALACGKAIVAHQEPATEGVVGSAAYLVASDDLRSFGAAMITVIVDEKAREKLEDAAWQRAAKWEAPKFQAELLKLYSGKN